MYLVETKDNSKKGKWKSINELGSQNQGHGKGVKPESEPMVEPEGTWKDDDKWWATTPGSEGHWTDKATWMPSWDSSEVTGQPEDLKWTETTAFWGPNDGTWDHDQDKWTGAEPEPEGKWKDDGKWTEPEPEPEDLKWTETTPMWTPGPPGPGEQWYHDKWTGDEPDPEKKTLGLRCFTLKRETNIG